MERLMDDSYLRKLYSRNAHRGIEKFSRQNSAGVLLKVYDEVLAESGLKKQGLINDGE